MIRLGLIVGFVGLCALADSITHAQPPAMIAAKPSVTASGDTNVVAMVFYCTGHRITVAIMSPSGVIEYRTPSIVKLFSVVPSGRLYELGPAVAASLHRIANRRCAEREGSI